MAARNGTPMLQTEDENDNDVRREDQDNINKFGRLNGRLHELREERASLQKSFEGMDDASTELMMGSGDDKVMIMMGEAFFETSEEDATEICEELVDESKAKLDKLKDEEEKILEEQADLKKILYGRFGKAINLEE